MLTAQQSSRLTAFGMNIFDEGQEVGSLDWSSFPTAKNSRIRGLVPPGISTPKILLRGAEFTIEFEYTKIGWHNDIRFLVKSGETELARAEVKQRWLARPALNSSPHFPLKFAERILFSG